MIIFFQNLQNNRALDAYINKHGPHFTVALAEYASSLMENVDGSSHTWDCNGIIKTCGQLNIYVSGKPFTYGDITYLANMAYADFYPKILVDPHACIKYAMAVLEDVDGYEGIAFYRWLADLKHKEVSIDWIKFL